MAIGKNFLRPYSLSLNNFAVEVVVKMNPLS